MKTIKLAVKPEVLYLIIDLDIIKSAKVEVTDKGNLYTWENIKWNYVKNNSIKELYSVLEKNIKSIRLVDLSFKLDSELNEGCWKDNPFGI